MHRALIISLSIILLIVATGCVPILSNTQSLQLTGSGKLVTQDFTFDSADRLLAASNYQVKMNPGESITVKVTTDDNLLPYVYVHVSNGELRLELKPGRAYDMDKVTMKAEVSMPTPSSVTLQGNATSDLGQVLASEMALRLSGNGIVTGEGISSARMSLTSGGNGQAKLSGAVAELKVDGRGNTIVACPELQAHTADITLRENGMAALHVTDKLDYNLSGNASLLYSGNPQLGQQQRSENATVREKWGFNSIKRLPLACQPYNPVRVRRARQ
ncbi:MAG: GIN domain-containing protein [Nitrososphaerales archaeon]